MKILEVIPRLCSGGAEKFTIDLCNEFVARHYNVILLTLFDVDESCTLEPFVNNLVKRVSLHKKSGFDIKCFFRLLSFIRKEKPDIVHAHVSAIKYLFFAAIVYKKCKYFATIHSEAKREAGRSIDKFSRKYLFKSGLVEPITISESSRASFIDYYGFNPPMVVNGTSTYTNHVSSSKNYKKDIDFLFVHAGRLIPEKNQVVLVKAFSSLLEEGVKMKLLLMGRKENASIYNAIAPYLSSNILYLGEQQDPREFMANADAFCLSSTIEGMPITIIEAMSVGCVPIVTPVGGCVNIVCDGVNGIVASDTSVEGYYVALKRFISLSQEERKKISTTAEQDFESKYSIARTAKDYIDLFSKQ